MPWKKLLPMAAILAVGCQDSTGLRTPASVPTIRAAVAHSTLTDLGIGSGLGAQAFSVNDKGEVSGSARQVVGARGFIWSPTRGFTDLGTLGGEQILAFGINNRSQVVGSSRRDPGAGPGNAFAWSAKTGMIDLFPDLPPMTEARAITESGDIIGTIKSPVLLLHQGARAFVWNERDGLTQLGTLPGGDGTVARDINQRGQVVGEASAGPGASVIHAYVWSRAEGMLDLGYVGPIPSPTGAMSINNRGHAVGTRIPLATSNTRGFYWTRETGMTELHPPGAVWSQALAINNSGQVAGFFFDGVAVHAFVWSENKGFAVLPELAARDTRAFSISESGKVAGHSMTPDGIPHAVIWDLH